SGTHRPRHRHGRALAPREPRRPLAQRLSGCRGCASKAPHADLGRDRSRGAPRRGARRYAYPWSRGMTFQPLPRIMIEDQGRAALLEDLGLGGDITSDAIIPASTMAETALVARKPGVVAGLDAAVLAFALIDPAIKVAVEKPDGSRLAKG